MALKVLVTDAKMPCGDVRDEMGANVLVHWESEGRNGTGAKNRRPISKKVAVHEHKERCWASYCPKKMLADDFYE